MSCLPSYTYVPSITSGPCLAPVYNTRRARTTIDTNSLSTPLFFRSVDQSTEANDISVELVNAKLNIYVNDVVVHSYDCVPNTPGAVAQLRDLFESDPNPYVEMPVLNLDINDQRTSEPDGPHPTPMLQSFPKTSLTGGVGAPTDATELSNINTGPSRTIFVVATEEDFTGSPAFPPPSRRIQQWNGSMWISYCNNVPGQCPGEGTC